MKAIFDAIDNAPADVVLLVCAALLVGWAVVAVVAGSPRRA